MNAGQFKSLVLIAALSFLPAIGFYYVGEEAIFPISSLEMWQRHEWVRQHLFGLNPQHNPLFNWLVIPIAVTIGWEYVLEVTRAIAIGATLATGAVVGWLAWRLLRDANFAWLAMLVYLTLADVLMYRGWLAYVDPLFGLFVFGAVAALWVACEGGRPLLFAVVAASLTCAFLSKAFTAYVFYGSAVLVMMVSARRRQILFSAPSIIAHVAALLAPLLWLGMLPANEGQGSRMFFEMIAKLAPAGVFDYLQKLLVFPAETMLRLSPAALLAGYFMLRGRVDLRSDAILHARTAFWISFLCYLPYWLAPASAIRYLVPIYPVIAFALAIVFRSVGAAALLVVRRWLVGMIALKFIAALVLFPYYQSHYRGENYLQASRQIMEISSGYPLYTASDTAAGLSVAGYIDAKWRRDEPILWVPAGWESGFVIAEAPDPAVGQLRARFSLGGDELYLLCRGAACEARR